MLVILFALFLFVFGDSKTCNGCYKVKRFHLLCMYICPFNSILFSAGINHRPLRICHCRKAIERRKKNAPTYILYVYWETERESEREKAKERISLRLISNTLFSVQCSPFYFYFYVFIIEIIFFVQDIGDFFEYHVRFHFAVVLFFLLSFYNFSFCILYFRLPFFIFIFTFFFCFQFFLTWAESHMSCCPTQYLHNNFRFFEWKI